MATSVQNQQVARASTGFTVARPTSLVAQALTSMFTIAGGRIIITAMYAKLTIATDTSNATTITVGMTNTEGSGASSASALASSTVVGVAREAGTHWVLGQTAGAALILGTNASSPILMHPRLLLGPGVITYTGGVGVNPGSAAWYLTYIPLDAAVTVVAN